MSDPMLEALWKNVLDNWDDERTHGAFLEHCQRSDQLAEAAVRYRGMKGDRVRGAIAEKRLSAVAMLALAKLETMRSAEPRTEPRSSAWMLVAFFLLASMLMLFYLSATK